MSTTAPVRRERTFFGQPMGLATLFNAELWERFSFYGMQAILVLYLIDSPTDGTPPGGGLGMDAGDAAAIFGAYSSLVYLTPLAGGWIADKLVGARFSVLTGGIVIAAGHFMMGVDAQLLFWLGLVLIALGTGLLKPNISKMVGDLYDEPKEASEASKRDAGFSIFYMGINLGAFIAPLIVGWLALSISWHVAFIAAGVGMLLGLAVYVAGWKTLHSSGLKPTNPATGKEIGKMAGIVAVGIAIFGAVFLIQGAISGFQFGDFTAVLTWAVVIIAVVMFVRIFRAKGVTAPERKKLKAFLGLFIGAVVFWMIYLQAGSTMSIFAQQWTDRSIFGWELPTSWLQSINPIFIIIFAPIFAAIWTWLGNRAPSTPMKFAMALIGIGISFVIMMVPGFMADNGVVSAIWWLVGVYLVQTWSELLLSPTGLSASTTLAPAGMHSQILALWFLATAVGASLGGQVVRLFASDGFGDLFLYQGLLAIVLGIVALFFVKPIARLMD